MDPRNANALVVDSSRKDSLVLDAILFCAKQDIALRGHRENEEDSNRGNFLELMDLILKYSPAPESREMMDKLPQNAKMLSHKIQNELLEAASTSVLFSIREEVQKSGYKAVMADECKLDSSKREIVSLRYLDIEEKMVKERAVGFIETEM